MLIASADCSNDNPSIARKDIVTIITNEVSTLMFHSLMIAWTYPRVTVYNYILAPILEDAILCLLDKLSNQQMKWLRNLFKSVVELKKSTPLLKGFSCYSMDSSLNRVIIFSLPFLFLFSLLTSVSVSLCSLFNSILTPTLPVL